MIPASTKATPAASKGAAMAVTVCGAMALQST